MPTLASAKGVLNSPQESESLVSRAKSVTVEERQTQFL